MTEYVYMIQEREYKNTNIFKIGKTIQLLHKRMNSYPKDSINIISIKIINCNDIEKCLIKYFSENFKQRTDIGTEYFEGDLDTLKNAFIKIAEQPQLQLPSLPSLPNPFFNSIISEIQINENRKFCLVNAYKAIEHMLIGRLNRSIDASHVDDIFKTFCQNIEDKKYIDIIEPIHLCLITTVNKTDKLYIVDGQHRYESLRKIIKEAD